MELTETSPNSITEYVLNMEKEHINVFTKFKDRLQPFSNQKNQGQKLDNTIPQENYAEFAGKVLLYYYKCAQECPKQEITELPNSELEKRVTWKEIKFLTAR